MRGKFIPRRTALYVPANNIKHIEKSRQLETDMIIFDLQESIPVQEKNHSRTVLTEALKNNLDFKNSTIFVRVNKLNSQWYEKDMQMLKGLKIDGVIFPDIETIEKAEQIKTDCEKYQIQNLIQMINIESALGVLNAHQILIANKNIECIIVGSSDLAINLNIQPNSNRSGLHTALSMIIIASRANGCFVLDGPHFDLKDEFACEQAARQSRDLGFDGKTIIHPVQIAYTNDVFTPKKEEIDYANQILKTLDEYNNNGRATGILSNKLIEPSYADWANKILSIDKMIANKENSFKFYDY